MAHRRKRVAARPSGRTKVLGVIARTPNHTAAALATVAPVSPKENPLIIKVFLTLGALLGLAYLFIIPPLQVPDEHAHFFRAAEVSYGGFVNAARTRVPSSYPTLGARFPAGLRNTFGELQPTTVSDLVRLAGQRDTSPIIDVLNGNVTIYPPVAYFPAALAIRISQLVHLSALLTMYAGRLFSLAAYLACCYLALQWLPFGRLIFVCLALMPMALHQAASLSADAVTNGVAFLYVAYIIRLSSSPKTPISRSEYLGLIAMAILLGLCKPTYWLIVVLVIFPARRFSTRWRWLGGVGLAGAATLLIGLSWQLLSAGSYARFVAGREGGGVFVYRNAALLVAHPFAVLGAIGRTLRQSDLQLLGQYIGKLGWADVQLPVWLIETYLLALVLACAISPTTLTKWQRVMMAAMSLISIVLVYFAMTRNDLPTDYLTDEILRGRGVLNVVQGRYFIPIAPMLFLAIAGMRPMPESRMRAALIFGWVTIASVVALYVVHRTYYMAPRAEEALLRRSGIGLFRQGRWTTVDGMRLDRSEFLPAGQLPGDIPVTGDWTGDGRTKFGIFRNGIWTLDTDGDHYFDEHDPKIAFGGAPGDVPVVGDWNGDGRSKIGIYRGGLFVLDFNGNHRNSENVAFPFGAASDVPVIGDWNGDGKDKVGIYRKGVWVLDLNGDRNGKTTKTFAFGGLPSDVPLVGDWTGDGKIKIGIFRNGLWVLDSNRDFRTGPEDPVLTFGSEGDLPLVLKAPSVRKHS